VTHKCVCVCVCVFECVHVELLFVWWCKGFFFFKKEDHGKLDLEPALIWFTQVCLLFAR